MRRPNTTAPKPAFSVMAIYDGFFTSIRAMEDLEWLKCNLLPDLQVCSVSWSFDKLALQDTRSKSIHAAASADLLMVSAPDESPLPDHMRQWFESIHLQEKPARPIIASLQDEDFEFNSTQWPLSVHLRQVADSWGTEFMCKEDFNRRLDCDFATQCIRSKSPASINRAKPFGGEFQPAPRFWGING